MKKGISLVALVITIIVLIILTATVMIIFSDGGILRKSEEAVFKSDFSNILDSFMLNKNNLMLEQLGNVNIENTTDENKIKENIPLLQNNNKSINEHKYTELIQIYENKIYQSDMISTSSNDKDKEISKWLEEIGIAKMSNVSQELQEYILGKDKNGRRLTEILDFSNYTFIDDNNTISNASEKVILLAEYIIEYDAMNKIINAYYIKYEDKVYKIITTITSEEEWDETTTSLTKVYEKSSDANNWEGRKVKFAVEEGGSKKDWTVLYDNGDTVDIIISDDFELNGIELYSFENSNEEEAIYSYNNAVDLLNAQCRQIVTNSKVVKENGVKCVRCAGSSPNFNAVDTTQTYNNAGLGKYNNRLKIGDVNSEEDIIRMTYFECNETGEEFWLASRYIWDLTNGFEFSINIMNDNLANSTGPIISMIDGKIITDNYSCYIRPIVRVLKSDL